MANETSRARRQNRYSDAEISLIKNTFAENDDLIFALRKLMLQMPLSPVDMEYLSVFKDNKELQALVSKAYLPQLEWDAPIGQVVDVYTLIPLSKDYITPDLAYPEMEVFQKTIDYFTQQLTRLQDPAMVVEGGIEFKQLSNLAKVTEEQAYVDMKSRNQIIVTSEAQLNLFYTLAGQKSETVDQTKQRLKKNSNK